MAKYENLGYCPFNEIIHTDERVWNELPDLEKGYRKALWELVGPYMVCDSSNMPYTVQAGKLFFGTITLGNHVLASIVKRYNFYLEAPIWIKQALNPDSTDMDVADYIISKSEKNADLICSPYDAGKFVVINDGDKEGELVIEFWNKSL